MAISTPDSVGVLVGCGVKVGAGLVGSGVGAGDVGLKVGPGDGDDVGPGVGAMLGGAVVGRGEIVGPVGAGVALSRPACTSNTGDAAINSSSAAGLGVPKKIRMMANTGFSDVPKSGC